MRISASQYAKTLYEITKGKSSDEVDELMVNFVRLLSKNNQIGFAEEIAEKFREIYNIQEGIVEAEITSREKLNESMLEKTEKFIKNKYKAEKVSLKNEIDEDILGGIIVKVGDEILDGSLRRSLAVLKNNLITN